MVRDFKQISKKALTEIAQFMCIAARTAPKTRGIDNLEILIIEDKETKKRLMCKMKDIGKRNERPSCIRDANNIKDINYIVIIGTKVTPLGLNCGFCGFKNCKELENSGGICVYNPMDLGISVSSAAGIASKFYVDNRVMYSIGKAALELGLFKQNVKIAIGIPLSATGKNPFFDRK